MSLPEFVITLIGNDTVGKTSIVNRLKYGTYQPHYLYTQGADQVRIPNFQVGSHLVSVLVFDTGGHHIQRNIIHKFIDAADAVMIVYDITNEKSFLKIPEWVAMTKRRNLHDINENSTDEDVALSGDDDPVLMLVGNKTDLRQTDIKWKNKNDSDEACRVIEEERLKQMTHSNRIHIHKEVSAKADINIDLAFKSLIEKLIVKRGISEKKSPIATKTDTMSLRKIKTPPWRKYCMCTIL